MFYTFFDFSSSSLEHEKKQRTIGKIEYIFGHVRFEQNQVSM